MTPLRRRAVYNEMNEENIKLSPSVHVSVLTAQNANRCCGLVLLIRQRHGFTINCAIEEKQSEIPVIGERTVLYPL